MKTHIFLFLAAGSFVWGGCTNNSKGNKEFAKGKEGGPVPVSSLVIQPQVLDNNIEVAGTILPNEKVDLKSEINGRITGIHFREGSHVQKGTLLVKLFDQDIKAQLKKARLQLDLAKKEEDRKKKLLEINGISQQEYDLAYNQAATLAADVDLLEAQYRKTEITAPFSGIVGLRNVSEGENVSSATLISSIQQVDPVKVEFDIPEKYSAFIKRDSKIKFAVAGSDKIYEGTVYASEPVIDITTRTLKVRALSSNKDHVLRPGSFVKIDLLLNEDLKALMVPTQAIVPGARGQKVFIFRNGLALAKEVKTGFRNEKNVQVTEGLDINDTIITSGIMQLKDSVRVILRKSR